MSNSILGLAESVLRRPTMYTIGGTYGEACAFIEGYVSCAALASPSNQLVEEWLEFEAWLRDRIGASAAAGTLRALHSSQGSRATEVLLDHVQEYSRQRATE